MESSPSVRTSDLYVQNDAYVGVSLYDYQNLRRVRVEPFEELATWDLRHESRATPSIECDLVFNGVDTGHEFFKCDALAEGSSISPILPFIASDYFVGSAEIN